MQEDLNSSCLTSAVLKFSKNAFHRKEQVFSFSCFHCVEILFIYQGVCNDRKIREGNSDAVFGNAMFSSW